MEELEIKYLQPIKTEQIDFNFDELKTKLTNNLKKYEGLVITEDAIQEGKKTKAELNKFRTAVENERKKVKNICLAPYNAYEEKIKELVNLIDRPIIAIDTQIKTFEQQQKDEKLEKIKEIYSFEADNVSDVYPFDRAFNPQWLNATVSLNKIKEEITAKVEIINKDLEVIATLNSEFELELYETYKQTLNLQDVILKNEKLKELKRIKAEAEAQALVEIQEPVIKEQVIEHPAQPTIKQVTFSVIVTKDQLDSITDFLIANEISFKQV